MAFFLLIGLGIYNKSLCSASNTDGIPDTLTSRASAANVVRSIPNLMLASPRYKHSTSSLPLLPLGISSRTTIPTLNVAIIGGGGMGCITAALLSKMTNAWLGIKVITTIFERNQRIISGSAFEAAAILHLEGREYPEDPETAKDCQMSGELWQPMIPELYPDDYSSGVLFILNEDSKLSPETQKETHRQAKKAKFELRNISVEHEIPDSQSDVPPELLQDFCGAGSTSAILSKDRPMNVFERDAYLRKFIENSPNVKIKAGKAVSHVTKNQNSQFNVIYASGEIDPICYDYTFVTAWDQTNPILRTSFDSSPITNQFIAEDRVLALCAIESVPSQFKIPIFTLGGGGMVAPLNDKIGVAYYCMEGASYPKVDEQGIRSEDAPEHGKNILDKIKEIHKRVNRSKEPFADVQLLGVRQQKIVRRGGVSLEKRRYESPMVTPEGVIVGIPPKATLVPVLALQSIEQFLLLLPNADPYLLQQQYWISEIQKIVPSAENLYTGCKLPEEFIIKNTHPLTKEEINNEVMWYLENCILTDAGEELIAIYQERPRIENIPLRRAHSVTGDSSFIFTDAPTIARASSDPSSKEVFNSPFLVKLIINNYKENKRIARIDSIKSSLYDDRTSTTTTSATTDDEQDAIGSLIDDELDSIE